MSNDTTLYRDVKKNAALFNAFFELAKSLTLEVEKGRTSHDYDPIKVGNRNLQNALCIKENSTSFFTNDVGLRNRLAHTDTGFSVEPAPFRETSRHNEYRFRLSNITVSSLNDYPEDFAQLVKDSVAYIQDPIAGHIAKK